jgi:hypothetical protein
MKKNLIKLNESILRRIIKESTKRVLREYGEDEDECVGNNCPIDYVPPFKRDMLDIGICVKKALEEYSYGKHDSIYGSKEMKRLYMLCNAYIRDYDEGVYKNDIKQVDW